MGSGPQASPSHRRGNNVTVVRRTEQVPEKPSFSADIALRKEKKKKPTNASILSVLAYCSPFFNFLFIGKMRKLTVLTIPFMSAFSPRTVQ